MATAVENASISLLAVFLRKIQPMLKLWIQDPDRKLGKKEHRALWQNVCEAIKKLPRKDSAMLVVLEPLILAGFSSRRRKIVNIAIQTWNETFGKDPNLRYPAQLEQYLQKLRGLVDLELPNLPAPESESESQISFYDSESEAAETPRRLQATHGRAHPFHAEKFARHTRSTSQSPTVPHSSKRKQSARRTPKARLRHDNSQINFEPVISSPSNPLQQESQLLTERQKEIIERQRMAAPLFSSSGAQKETQEDDMPQDILSDPMAAELMQDIRTPTRDLSHMGLMDVYLGSSPTPSARNRRHITRGDDVHVPISTAVQPVQQSDDLEQFGSSPPRFDRQAETPVAQDLNDPTTDDIVGDSFEYRQPEQPLSGGLSEGTTVDDETILAIDINEHAENVEEPLVEPPTEDDYDTPSSTVELQLNAQLEGELNARSQSNNDPEEGDTQHDSNLHLETIIQHGISNHEELSDQPKSEDEKLPDVVSTPTRKRPSGELESSQVRKLRRSTRHSTTPSPSPVDRKNFAESNNNSSGRKRRRKAATDETSITTEVSPTPSSTKDLDCIVVASPKVERASRRKTRSCSDSPQSSTFVVPETVRKRSIRRSTSLLDQVENISDEIVEETPAAKRPRNDRTHDASNSRVVGTSPPPDAQAITKRLSHIQVTPKRSPAARTTALEPINDDETVETEQPDSQVQPLTAAIATPSRSFAERVILTPRSILNRLKKIVSDCSNMVLGRAEEEEFRDVLHEISSQVHAGRWRGRGAAE